MTVQTLMRVERQIGALIKGQDTVLRKLLAAWIAGIHVLIEDYPGTGKTTLAKTLARSVAAQFSRIQFTPDLLPSDIIGVTIWRQQDNTFHFYEGPLFTNILLADEINRASPRTQSALLEAMAESQVTVDGTRRQLPYPYFVIATQNPIESHGTYPLPEAQLDRFGLRLTLGYVRAEEEIQMLEYSTLDHPVEKITPSASISDLHFARQASAAVNVTPELRAYIVALVHATRQRNTIRIGASPRASITLFQLARTLAFLDNRDFVTPDDIQDIAVEVLAHRLVIESQAHYSGVTAQNLIREILAEIPVPI